MENLDEFNLSEWLPILEQVADEKDIGKVGVVKWNEPAEQGKGFKEVFIDENTQPIQFDFDGLYRSSPSTNIDKRFFLQNFSITISL